MVTGKVIKTLLSSEKYKYLSDVDDCIYLVYIETNSFFRKSGVCKASIEALAESIDLTKDMVVSEETEMGRVCNVYNNLCKILKEKGHVGNVKKEYEIESEIEKAFQKRFS